MKPMPGQMTLADVGLELNNKAWEYDEDTGYMLCRCPECGGRMVMHLWHYWNNYKYCPYCGIRLQEGNFVKRYCQIYEREDEQTVRRVRREYGRENGRL
jgi:DNA-directed RNA polymerase subunit RPC12/RpoP